MDINQDVNDNITVANMLREIENDTSLRSSLLKAPIHSPPMMSTIESQMSMYNPSVLNGITDEMRLAEIEADTLLYPPCRSNLQYRSKTTDRCRSRALAMAAGRSGYCTYGRKSTGRMGCKKNPHPKRRSSRTSRKSTRCSRGRKISGGCKRKSGRKSHHRVSRRKSTRRLCSRGRKVTGGCKAKPGPKRSYRRRS